MILLRVSIFILLFMVLPNLYLYPVYVREWKNRWMRMAYFLPELSLLICLLVLLNFRESYSGWMGHFLIGAMLIFVPKTCFIAIDGGIRIFNRLFRRKIRPSSVSSIVAIGTAGIVIYGAIWGKERFTVREVVFTSPDLPQAFEGYRILQISDIHSGSWHKQSAALQRAIDICNKQRADIAVFTGDLINGDANELTEFMPILSQLRTKDGVYSVMGNHDYGTHHHWQTSEDSISNINRLQLMEEQMGWKMLNNAHVQLYRGKDSISLVGVENSGNPPFPNEGDLHKALQGTTPFKILLSHDPTHWRREVLPNSDVQLMLAGHTHDMQISIFGFSFSRFFYPEHHGMYIETNGKLAPRGLYVNVGLGYVLLPFRIGAWPEITIITLKKS